MVIHRDIVVLQPRCHACNIAFDLGRDLVKPLFGRGFPVVAHGIQERRYTRADITNNRRSDFNIAVHFPGLDINLDKGFWLVTPAFALAVRQQPVEARADHHHNVGFL